MPEPTQSNEPWRRQGPAEKAEYKAWVEALVEERWQKGIETYDPEELGFQGLPEDHAPEESLDGLFYNWYAKRRIKYLLGRIAELEARIKELEAS